MPVTHKLLWGRPWNFLPWIAIMWLSLMVCAMDLYCASVCTTNPFHPAAAHYTVLFFFLKNTVENTSHHLFICCSTTLAEKFCKIKFCAQTSLSIHDRQAVVRTPDPPHLQKKIIIWWQMYNELANRPNYNESHHSSFNKPHKQFTSHGYCHKRDIQVYTGKKKKAQHNSIKATKVKRLVP